MIDDLFSEFNSVSSKQWKQQIQFDLKGADYNETLIWKSNEDISVKPFYHSEDLNGIPETSISNTTGVNICQTIFVADVIRSNKKALEALQSGADSIQFIIPTSAISINDLLKNITIEETVLYFELQFLDSEFITKLTQATLNGEIYIKTDIIGNLARSGNWFSTLQEDHNTLETIIKTTNTLSIDTTLYQNAGANIVQQLAYALSHANEYLNHFKNSIESEKKQRLKVLFNLSVGSNYFFEIAKFRALRLLWNTLACVYNVNTDCHIFATPTKRNKTLYDYNTNLLRSTTECMSAMLGGANCIHNLAYDAIFSKTNEFSTRIARNQLLILKHEAYLNKVNNPSDGAYYIESLTHQLAEKALELLKNIEANGGFLKQLKEGTIQRKIKEVAAKEQHLFDSGELVLLGTNSYTNAADKMKNNIELYPFVKTKQRKTLIEPIIEKRLSEGIEQYRLKQEE